MAKLTIQVRTRNNLLELLASGQSPAWVVAAKKAERLLMDSKDL